MCGEKFTANDGNHTYPVSLPSGRYVVVCGRCCLLIKDRVRNGGSGAILTEDTVCDTWIDDDF